MQTLRSYGEFFIVLFLIIMKPFDTAHLETPFQQLQFLQPIQDLCLAHCEEITGLINTENAHEEHMTAKTPQKLLTDSLENGFVWLQENEALKWYFWLMKWGELWEQVIYEAGSLVVDPAYRNKWMGNLLVKTLFETFQEKPIYLVTNVAAVMKSSEKAWAIHIPQDKLSLEIKQIIESQWALLEDDTIYVNTTLFHKFKIW